MDKGKESKVITILKGVFLFFVFAICMYFVLGQFFCLMSRK